MDQLIWYVPPLDPINWYHLYQQLNLQNLDTTEIRQAHLHFVGLIEYFTMIID